MAKAHFKETRPVVLELTEDEAKCLHMLLYVAAPGNSPSFAVFEALRTLFGCPSNQSGHEWKVKYSWAPSPFNRD